MEMDAACCASNSDWRHIRAGRNYSVLCSRIGEILQVKRASQTGSEATPEMR